MSYTVQHDIHRLSCRLLECLLPQQLLSSQSTAEKKQTKKKNTEPDLHKKTLDWPI